MGRWERTHASLLQSAAQLFEEQGYEDSTTAQIASRAGVSEMTLFRHFPTKESLVLTDPFDPMIADAVRGRPTAEGPMRALVEGVRDAWAHVDQDELRVLRQRLRVIAETPALRGAIERSSGTTADALALALGDRGVEQGQARVASAAVIAGLSAALLDWAQSPRPDLSEALAAALTVLGGE